MAQLMSRGGIYIVFIIGMAITWVMNRYFKKKSAPIILPEAEAKTEADFIAALGDKDWHLRLWGAEHLIGVATEAAIPALVKRLEDEDPDVREAASQALIPLGSAASQAVIPLMQSRRLDVREAAVKVLVTIADSSAIECLAQVMIDDDSAWVRIPAIEAIGKQKDSHFHAALVQILHDEHEGIYQAAKTALLALDTPQAHAAIGANPYQANDKKANNNLEELG